MQATWIWQCQPVHHFDGRSQQIFDCHKIWQSLNFSSSARGLYKAIRLMLLAKNSWVSLICNSFWPDAHDQDTFPQNGQCTMNCRNIVSHFRPRKKVFFGNHLLLVFGQNPSKPSHLRTFLLAVLLWLKCGLQEAIRLIVLARNSQICELTCLTCHQF